MSYNGSASMFIGTTSRGRAMPVFYDPHTAIFNSKPPATLITGKPGSGKTFLALTLTAISAILGKTTIVLDPKGDFLSLTNLQREIGKFTLWNLAQGGRAGMLDPFYMTNDPAEKLSLVTDVIEIFANGISRTEKTALAPIIRDVIEMENPSLQKVVDALRASRKQEARDLGTELSMLKDMKFAKLCFAPGNKKRMEQSIEKGLTVATLVGLQLPSEGGPKNTAERLGAGIIFLLTDYIYRIMMNDTSRAPKTLVIDECHAVLATPVGARTIQQVALLGRSRSLALILITQNNSHITGINIENTISTRFAFSSDRKEATNIIKAMELPDDEDFETRIVQLETGECLMQDFRGRYSTMKVANWNEEWFEAFQNNPLELERRKRAAEAELNGVHSN